MTTTKKANFTDIIADLLKAQGTVCAICAASNREEIEAAQKSGAPFSMIAKTLQKLGTIDPNVTLDTAAKRVRVHFTTPHEGTKA